jgi:putative RecB family exonuclease
MLGEGIHTPRGRVNVPGVGRNDRRHTPGRWNKGGKKMTQYSHSRLGTFETCPYQYKLRYIERISSDVDGIEAFMGSRVHEVLEKLYLDKRRCKENTLKELLDYYDEQWEKNWHDGVVIVKKEYSAQNYRDMGRKAIEEYYAKYHPFDEGKVIGTEKKVRIPLGNEGGDTFAGVIDRLMLMPDGSYEIHDYKASANLMTQDKADTDRQLALYQVAVENDWPDAKDKVGLVWHYVVFDKEIRSKRTREQLDALVKEVNEKIKIINNTTEFKPNESYLCQWCGYQHLCPTKKHEIKVAELPVNKFLEDDGVQLVNRFVEVEVMLKELGAEKEELKEAIREYSEREDVSTIKGSGYKVRVSRTENVTFPSKSNDEEAYMQFVEDLKENATWEEISCPDKSVLRKLMKQPACDRELKALLERYALVEMQTRITKQRLKEEL